MGKVIIIGGGFAGCAAALAASRAGASVSILEKTDMVIGLGNVGGIFRNNGRFTAAEENIAMGADELFLLMDELALHKNINFPGNNHSSFYNVTLMEPRVRKLLLARGINLLLQKRVTDVKMSKRTIEAVITSTGEEYFGDTFIDCTGTSGPMGNCMEFGQGCAMCVQRCPAFGPRVSISALAGGKDYMYRRPDGAFGAMSGSCKLVKSSLSRTLERQLSRKGFVVVPIPLELVKKEKLDMKVCRQYALDDFAENIIAMDTGFVKVMTPFISLEQLRKVKGFENARFADPYAGGRGNSIRYLAMTMRDDFLRVDNVENLFCAGEKAGPFIGHTEAISTGSLAGYNAAKMSQDKDVVKIPESCAVGALIAYHGRELMTFAGDKFFRKMKEEGLYSIDPEEIKKRVPQGLYHI